MHVIQARNVNYALSAGLAHLNRVGVAEPSRNGPVLVAPTPVTTVYERPAECVLLSPARDANPYFHLMEALWMLAGRRDLAFLTRFNPRMAEFSDDGGVTQPGAYGYRWRRHFGYDQLDWIVYELQANPSSRRCVLTHWDAGQTQELCPLEEPEAQEGSGDLYAALHGGRDVPCNTHCYVAVREGTLVLTILCRSNDALWGAYGANAVHFSLLQQYLAARIGVPVGPLYQVSCNYHAYTELKGYPDARNPALRQVDTRYDDGKVESYPLVHLPELWDGELRAFLDAPTRSAKYENYFFSDVAVPTYRSWEAYKLKEYDRAIENARDIVAKDWRAACVEWLERRAARRAAKGEGA